MYIGIDIRLIDLSLCFIICSQIKKDKGFGCQTRTINILSPNKHQSTVCFPRGLPRQHPVASESPKWANNLRIHSLMREWCHLCAILIEILQQKYFLLLLISLETITPHVRRVGLSYIHKFLQLLHQLIAVLYMISSNCMTHCISQTCSYIL